MRICVRLVPIASVAAASARIASVADSTNPERIEVIMRITIDPRRSPSSDMSALRIDRGAEERSPAGAPDRRDTPCAPISAPPPLISLPCRCSRPPPDVTPSGGSCRRRACGDELRAAALPQSRATGTGEPVGDHPGNEPQIRARGGDGKRRSRKSLDREPDVAGQQRDDVDAQLRIDDPPQTADPEHQHAECETDPQEQARRTQFDGEQVVRRPTAHLFAFDGDLFVAAKTACRTADPQPETEWGIDEIAGDFAQVLFLAITAGSLLVAGFAFAAGPCCLRESGHQGFPAVKYLAP